MQVAIVEDDPIIAKAVTAAVAEAGHECRWIDNGSAAGDESLLASDLVILDLMLPGEDGLAVLRRARAHGVRTPVIVLTAKGLVAEKVQAFEAGADDYLVKPFAFSELLARVGAQLRRGAARSAAPVASATLMSLADLELDLVSRKAVRAGQRLHLTAKEFALLTLLLRRQGQILSRSTLAEQVWDMNFDSDTNVVEVAVRRLRAKLDDPFRGKLLHNVRGMGYVLEQRSGEALPAAVSGVEATP